MEHIGTQLKRHIKFEHQDIRYSCDKSFHQQGVLERHVKSEHKKIIILVKTVTNHFIDKMS